MHEPHPNLNPEINASMADSELVGGVWLHKPEFATAAEGESLPVGKSLKVKTRNTEYLIENREDGTYISGHATYCPVPTKCFISGSTWGGSVLKVGWVGVGMYLEFSTDEFPYCITTSRIADVQIA